MVQRVGLEIVGITLERSMESQEEKESSVLFLFCKLLSDSIDQVIGRIIP